MTALRPRLTILAPEEIARIAGDAVRVLETVGFAVENEEALALLRSAGLEVAGQRVRAGEAELRRTLATVPARVTVYDREGSAALDLGGDTVHYDPGSAALHILDPATRRRRRPTTRDLVHLAWVTQACAHLAAQSTALVPADVPDVMSDRWRLYVALLHSRKPVVTGTFCKDAFAVMRAMLAAVRGGEAALRKRPLAIFDCCPTAPLKWSDLTCQALIDCARAGIPAQLVSMPLGGATAPVTLREMVVQHCAENLSGVLIHQLAAPGAPIIYGGSPAAFDMRHGTTPMGAIETMMVDVAYAAVGKHLGLPTHAYMGPSDAKSADHQAGLESGLGIVLAALGGINLISGPGLLDFENCQSLEKLVLDNEACGMALRLVRGIGTDSAARAVSLVSEGVAAGSFLGLPHTRAAFRAEQHFPGPAIDRGSYGDWEARGASDAQAAAAREVQRILASGALEPAPAVLRDELNRLLREETARLGIDLPAAVLAEV